MKRSTYDERDYTFGRAMLTLRMHFGLTQAGLAAQLHVSRRAVAEWEAGSAYPSTDHLKQLIVLGVQQQAFAVGREAEEIRALWRAAHQKILLDELWLQGLLDTRRPQLAPVVLLPGEQAHATDQALPRPELGPRVDWGDALAVPSFYDREGEVATLTAWVVQERCRVVSVLGMGGIGKSALAVSLMHQVAPHFEVVIWRSLRDAPACDALLEDYLRVLAPQPLADVPVGLEERQGLLLEYLRDERALLVLDNLEALLEEGESTGRVRTDYEGYARLLRRVAQTEHQSCLLLTSREKPGELVPLEGSRMPVRSLRLSGLEREACEQLIEERELMGGAHERARLIERYGGNPLALKIVAQTIADLFGGEIALFLVQDTVAFGSIAELLGEQFDRLSAIEQTVLLWLAILREPVSIEELLAVLGTPLPRMQVLEALRRRSLIERGKQPGSFTLQSVVLEYVTARLITEAASEIEQGHMTRLIEHGLELATSREYVRQTQQRLIVARFWRRCGVCTGGERKWRRGYSRCSPSCGNVPTMPRGMDRRTCFRCCASSAGTCAAWISPSSPFGGRLCKASRCRIRRLPGPACVTPRLPRLSMTSGRWLSAATEPTGRHPGSGGRCGCGERQGRSCTCSGRHIPIR